MYICFCCLDIQRFVPTLSMIWLFNNSSDSVVILFFLIYLDVIQTRMHYYCLQPNNLSDKSKKITVFFEGMMLEAVTNYSNGLALNSSKLLSKDLSDYLPKDWS